MMADPPNRSTNAAGGKIYTHPVSGEVFDSVTTVLGLIDKDALKQWAANLSADFVIEHMPQIFAAMLVEPCGNTFNRCYQKHGRDNTCERCACGNCLPCWRRRAVYRHAYESGRRSEEGVECHAAIHHWVTTGGQVIEMRDQVKPYFESFVTWTLDYGLHPNGQPGQGDWEQLEITLLNREHGYAGTSDGAMWIRRGRGRDGLADHIVDRIGGPNAEKVLIRVDYKTREKPDERMFNDMPLQGVAYERCTKAMLPDGREFDPPTTHARAILQLRPNAYSFKPMLSDDGVFEAFLGVLTAYRWIHGPGKNAFDLETWAAIPPGVLGTPELSDPWSTSNDEPRCERCDHAPHPGHACDPGCFCHLDPAWKTDRVVVPFVTPNHSASAGAQVVPLPADPTRDRLEQQVRDSVTWASDAETEIPTYIHGTGPDGDPFTIRGPNERVTPDPPQEAPESVPDPFASHNAKEQVEADMRKAPRPSRTKADTSPKATATADSIRGFKPGSPDTTVLDEPIPF